MSICCECFQGQECIPVGYVPPSAVAVMGVSTPPGAGNPPSRLPPGAGTPPQEQKPHWPLGFGPGPDPPQLPPWVWAWRPPRQIPLNFPLGCEPGNLQDMLGYHPTWIPAARHAGIPPAMHAGIAPPCGQTHTCKNITFANFVCGR